MTFNIINPGNGNYLTEKNIEYDHKTKTVHVVYDCAKDGFASKICKETRQCKKKDHVLKLQVTTDVGSITCTITASGTKYVHTCGMKNQGRRSNRRRRLLQGRDSRC